MEFINYKTGINDIDRRLDKIIKVFLPDLSLSEIYKYLRKGLIKLNNKKTKPDTHINQDDIISVAEFIIIQQQKNQKNSNQNIKINEKMPEIIFQNEHILIINKPYNCLVQGNGTKEQSLDKIIQNYYEQNNKIDSISFKTGPLHRLDKNTSGILCFSQSLKGAKWFSENIKTHKITKKYRAIMEGTVISKEIWQDYISKDFDINKKFQTVKILNNEKPNSHTEITPISYGNYENIPVTYAEIDIKTGKTHQIRAQSSFHNHPLLGDNAYGAQKTTLLREYFLHAYEIYFPENDLNIPTKIQCSLPKDMENILLKIFK